MEYPELRLVSHKLCPYVQRARIVLAEKQIPHTIEFIDLGNKPDWFLKISPLGKVPVLLVDSKPLFESNVITEFLDEISIGSLHPKNAFEKARNRAWIEFASATLGSIASLYRAKDKSSFDDAVALLKQRFVSIEKELGSGPWFNGTSFSIVDAAFGPVFRYFEVIEQIDNLGIFDDTPQLNAWRRSLAKRKSVQRAVVPEYHQRLHCFFAGLDSWLSKLMQDSNRQIAWGIAADCA